MSVPSFSHPAGTLDPAIAKLTAAEAAFAALGYAIQKGDLQSILDMLEGDEFNHQLLKTADYAGNTALVSDIWKMVFLLSSIVRVIIFSGNSHCNLFSCSGNMHLFSYSTLYFLHHFPNSLCC